MCTSGDEEEGGASTSTGGSYSGGEVPEIVVTAPRIGLDQTTIDSIDWSEVARLGAIGLTGGAVTGVWTSLAAGLTGAAAAIESQDGIDLEDLFEIKDDMIVIPGLTGPYVPIY